MDIVERGQGVPLVLVPGIQGRWEYMRPAVDALAEHFRVLTFSLSGEPGSGSGRRPDCGFDGLTAQVDRVLDDRGLRAAIVCGVSFGGLIALRYAATRPGRTLGLVLVSTPAPGWHLRPRHAVYARLPWIFGPLFLAETPFRLRDELRAALPEPAARRRFARGQLRTFLQAPVSVGRMAARARLIATADAAGAAAMVTTPTLVVTGEPALDHVLATRAASPYATLIRKARSIVLTGTGHLGLVTKPEAFAAHLKAFADEAIAHAAGPRARGAAHDAA